MLPVAVRRRASDAECLFVVYPVPGTPLSFWRSGIFHSPRDVFSHGRFFSPPFSRGRGFLETAEELRQVPSAFRVGAYLGKKIPAARSGATAACEHRFGDSI